MLRRLRVCVKWAWQEQTQGRDGLSPEGKGGEMTVVMSGTMSGRHGPA